MQGRVDLSPATYVDHSSTTCDTTSLSLIKQYDNPRPYLSYMSLDNPSKPLGFTAVLKIDTCHTLHRHAGYMYSTFKG